ncbi:MAG TPA: helix-turn-helix transcriptional regulator [Cyclobacteriaceae bacterium]|nr:helix-turn-helix transcriptional regulator [Cyclobacteriaceae bacterium]
MKIEHFYPSPALTPFIKEFILIESELETDNKTIPGTSMVMAFRYRGRVAQVNEGSNFSIASATLSGLRKTVRIFKYSGDTANLLVIFNEGGVSAFSRLPSHELFGLTISSENLFPPTELEQILESLAEAATNKDRINIVESFLLSKIISPKKDTLIDHAVKFIIQQRGNIRMKDLVSSLPLSRDPFEKRFRAWTGSTPKQFASIVRLRNLIKKYPAHRSLTDVAYDAGYFDQSHFIKDFRLFTGQSPKEFFSAPSYW